MDDQLLPFALGSVNKPWLVALIINSLLNWKSSHKLSFDSFSV
jgi:hypothetical protein